MIYAFGGYELDEALFELRRDTVRVAMEPKVFNVLAYLITHRDRVVTKDELMEVCWPGCFITESALVRSVVQARKAVGDDGVRQKIIKTIRGRGYRFIASVEPDAEESLNPFDTLPEQAQQLLACAAVIGPEFRLEVLEHLSMFPSARLAAMLEHALNAQVVEEVPGTVGRYRFIDPGVREGLYNALSATVRVQHHRQIGLALESMYGVHSTAYLETIANHYYAAALLDGKTDQAIDYTVRAGEWATAVQAFPEAVEQYTHALHLLELHDGSHTQPYGALLLELGDVQLRCGDTAQARASLLQVAELGCALGSTELHLGATSRLSMENLRLGTLCGWTDQSDVALLEAALQETPETRMAQRAELLSHLAVASASTEPHRAAALSHEAIALAVQVPQPTTQILTLLGRHWTMCGPDDVEEQLATALRVVQLAQPTSQPELALLGHHWSITDFLHLGDIDAVERAVHAYTQLAEHIADASYRSVACSLRAMCAILGGQLVEGERHVHEAHTVGSSLPHHGLLLHTVEPQRLFLYLMQDRRDECEQALAAWAPGACQRFVWRCMLAWLLSELGRNVEAHTQFEACITDDIRTLPRDGDWLASLSHLALVSAQYKDVRHAELLYRLLVPYAAYNVTSGPYLYHGSVAHYLGVLATTMTEWEAAQEHFDTALAMHQRLSAEPLVAATQYAYARMLSQRSLLGDHAKACHVVDSALQTAESLHLTRLVTQARALYQELTP